jgi:alpha-glucosidase
MDRIPIFARGGAIIPMWPDAPPSTGRYHPCEIELHLFVPVAEGSYSSFLQEDDGLTVSGGFVRTTFEVTRTADRVEVHASVEGDGYPEFQRTTFELIVHGAAAGPFKLANAGTGFELQFEV